MDDVYVNTSDQDTKSDKIDTKPNIENYKPVKLNIAVTYLLIGMEQIFIF